MTLHRLGPGRKKHKKRADVVGAIASADKHAEWLEALESLNKDEIPQGSQVGERAYRVVHDEAALDGNASLNLATFVSTWMDDFAAKLYAESYDKNMIDKDEYPVTAAIEQRCVCMVADLFHAEDLRDDDPSTVGGKRS